jgi:hypothetical protein
MTPATDWAAAANGRLGLAFDGIDDYVEIEDSTFLEERTPGFTVHCTFQVDPLDSGNPILANWNPNNNVGGYLLTITDNAKVLHATTDGNFNINDTENSVISVDKITTLSVWWDSPSTTRIWVDGREVAVSNNSTSVEDTSTSDAAPVIGLQADGPTFFDGVISDVLITANGSPQQAQSYYDQARRGFPDLLRRRSDVGLLGGGGGAPSPISGTAAITDNQEQFSATGQTEVSGTLSVTDGSETLTVDGATKISGAASITEAAEQISGVGSVITTGTVSITDRGEIISAVSSLQDITGSAQITDAAGDVSATGEVKIAGTATLNDGTEEVIIVGQNDVTGSLSFADLAAQIAAEGAVEVQGSLAFTDAGESITARERVPARLARVNVRLEDIMVVHATLEDALTVDAKLTD